MAQIFSALTVPWNAFVGAFLYYTFLTLLTVGGADLPAVAMAVIYLVPLAAYAVFLVNRAVRALAALPIDLGETPHALAR
jgi:hypothetical protein